MLKNNSLSWGLILLILAAFVSMAVITVVDYDWTVWLRENEIDAWGQFMRRTMFEGHGFGGSDPGIIFMLLGTVAYFHAYPGSRFPRLQRNRPYFGFLFFSSLVTGLGLVHSIKWMLGRARPSQVLVWKTGFSHWYEFGAQHVSDGIFRGSFPSGHTAAAFIMMTFAYFLAADPTKSLKRRSLGWLWGILVLIYAIAMSIGRSMTKHHWIGDGVGSIFIGWIAIHLIYFHILKIPKQVSYIRKHGTYPDLANYWELKLVWRLLVATLAVMATVIGIKAVIFQKAPFLILMAIPALPVFYFTIKSLIKVYTENMAVFETDNINKSNS